MRVRRSSTLGDSTTGSNFLVCLLFTSIIITLFLSTATIRRDANQIIDPFLTRIKSQKVLFFPTESLLPDRFLRFPELYRGLDLPTRQ